MTVKNVADFYPLSPMQQGMLFHSLYAPDSGVYVEQLTCTLCGRLDAPAFARAWQRVMERHAILRTAFIGEGFKEPVQVVHRQVDLPLEQQNWRGLSPLEQAPSIRVEPSPCALGRLVIDPAHEAALCPIRGVLPGAGLEPGTQSPLP